MKIESQIKAIKKQIARGKVKNIFAASKKIELLELEIKSNFKKKSWSNFLAQ